MSALASLMLLATQQEVALHEVIEAIESPELPLTKPRSQRIVTAVRELGKITNTQQFSGASAQAWLAERRIPSVAPGAVLQPPDPARAAEMLAIAERLLAATEHTSPLPDRAELRRLRRFLAANLDRTVQAVRQIQKR